MTERRISSPAYRILARRAAIRMIHLGHLPDANGSPEDATGIPSAPLQARDKEALDTNTRLAPATLSAFGKVEGHG